MIASEGDTVACALVRSGVHIFSRSMKFHRPRGLYCGSGRCVSCVMRVNGIPGVRTCVLPVSQDMVVESEGGFPTTRFDALSVLDHVFRKEFEYRSRFIRPRFLTSLYQTVVRRVAASARLPDKPSEYPRLFERPCEVLVIGQGVSGAVASASLRGAGIRGVVSIDRMQESDERIPSVAFGVYEGGEVGVQANNGIQILRPRIILLATGRFETGLPLVNGDLPGVMLTSALFQLASRRVAPGKRAVIIGRNDYRAQVTRSFESVGTELLGDFEDPALVSRVIGRNRVSGVELAGSRRKLNCDAVVVLGPLVPAVELAQQAGCEPLPKEGFMIVRTDSVGRTSVPNIYACGGVAGFWDFDGRVASAKRAAAAIVNELEAG